MIVVRLTYEDGYHDGFVDNENGAIRIERDFFKQQFDSCEESLDLCEEYNKDLKEGNICYIDSEEQIKICKLNNGNEYYQQYKVKCRFTFFEMGEWKTTIEEIISNELSCGDYDWADTEILSYETIC